MHTKPVKHKFIAAVFSALLMTVSSVCFFGTDSKASAPEPLNRVSVESVNDKCAEIGDFDVTFIFGADEYVFDESSLNGWLVTKANYEEYAAEIPGEGDPKEGCFLIGGKESVFPESVSFEYGFAVDEDGALIVSESAMYDSLKKVFDIYNYKAGEQSVVFYSSSGRTVYFGEEPEQIADVNLDAQFNILKRAVSGGKKGVKKTVYTKEQYDSEGNIINTVGDSYIEVDLTEQHMYMYLEGELIVDTPVVTGNLAWGANTPSGVFPILNMARNATLVGDNYRTPVSYWIAFTNMGHGIHDSTWRTTGYGGDIYTYDGSHGCVNTPIEKVSVIYENAYVGLPVVVFE